MPGSSLRVALLQLDPRPGDLAGNLARGFAALRGAAAGGADVAVLPEVWPRTFADAVASPAEPVNWDAVLDDWRREVAAAGIWCIGGLTRGGEGDRRNSLYVLDRAGRVAGCYDKIHLFSPLGEPERFRAGVAPLVLDVEGLRLGCAICYDLRFPEQYRAMRAAGAHAFVTVAQWPASRQSHWDTLLRARAIENLAAHVGVNRVGTLPGESPLVFGGGSAAISPWGEDLCRLGDGVAVGNCVLDRERIDHVRRGFGAWADRRFDLRFPVPPGEAP